MTLQLFYSPGACSLAPHIVLREAGVPFELVKVNTKTHQVEGGDDYYAINPKGYVPALGLETGQILTEGPAITQYIADTHPEANLAPKSGTLERARVNEWLTFIGTEIHKGFGPLFNPATSDDQKPAIKAKIAERFALAEQLIADGSAYLTGDTYSVADAYLFVVVNWAGFVGIDLGSCPKVKAIHARIAARPATQAAMKAEGLGG